MRVVICARGKSTVKTIKQLALQLLIFSLLSLFFIAISPKKINSIGLFRKQGIQKKVFPIEVLPKQFQAEANLLYGITYDHLIKDSSYLSFNNFTSFSDNYSNDTLSVFCFRGNASRNSPSRGRVFAKPTEIVEDWKFVTNYDTSKTIYGVWGGGSGWTGQPLIINWNQEQKEKLHITDQEFLNDPTALEVIIGSLCGDIYFLNSETGTATRNPLSIHNTIKGTVSVDPRKNGLLYVGQGIPHTGKMGAYVFDMFDEKEIYHIPGIDNFAKIGWGAFDSNPLIDANSGTIFWPSENGLIYKFTIDSNKIVHPPLKFKYTHDNLFRHGIESSMAAKGKYGFVSDNSGTVMCIDLESMKPIWNIDNLDDSDASIVFETEEKNHWSIYIGNEVDKRAPKSEASFKKINAVNGSEIWKVSRECYGTELHGKTNSGGILSTPVLGKHQGKNIVYTIFSRVDEKNRAELIAVNKKTGKELFSIFLDKYSWSSPVDFYDAEGNIYLFFTDLIGNLYIIDGVTGETLVKKKTNNLIEASPVIINDRIIIASRGKSILSYIIK